MPKLTKGKTKELKDAILQYPTKSDREIGKIVKVSHVTVNTHRKEMDMRYDSEFIQATAGLFIKYFGQSAEYWANQITKLEELKHKKKKVVRQNGDTGGYFQTEVELTPMEILAIEKEQAALQSRILFLAGQGKVREVIKLMRSGELQHLIN